MNTRKLSRALGPKDVRAINAAAHTAERLGAPFNAMVTIHFGMIASPPADAGHYLRRAVVNRLGVWMRRQGISWTALWVLENFEGQHRIHVHLLVHIPGELWKPFCAATRRWWPEGGAVDVRRATNVRGAVRYLSKQLSPQARFATGYRIRRQARCRHTGAPVAPVLGKRFGMTRNLSTHIKHPVHGDRRA